MEWSDIGKFIGRAAPLIGGILTGGTSTAVAAVGEMLGAVLGTESTPDAIHKAIMDSPDAAVKLAEIEAQNRLDLEKLAAAERTAERQADASDLAAINDTMREEAKSEHWLQWSWRPLNGYALAVGSLASVGFCGSLAFVAVFGGKPEAINMVPTLASAFALVLGVPGAVCGVTAWHRGVAQTKGAAK